MSIAFYKCDFGELGTGLAAAKLQEQATADGLKMHMRDGWLIDPELKHTTPFALLNMVSPRVEVQLAVFGVYSKLDGTTLYGKFPLDGEVKPSDPMVLLQFVPGALSFSTFALNYHDALRAHLAIRDLFPPHTYKPTLSKPMSYVTFWMDNGGEPERIGRNLDVVAWKDIATNYPRATGDGLQSLMTRFAPRASGQILLFHGPPGTGKTWALRALSFSWRKWCSLHYIMDVPAFLGGSPNYINTLLFSDEESRPVQVAAEEVSDNPTEPFPTSIQSPTDNWRLIVMEDTGELITTDANGAGLARLLNAADGLLGQGAKVMFLITTNETINKLHPAITRPGRCVANLSFDKFTEGEAREWLIAKGLEGDSIGTLPRHNTLAELYAIIEKREQIIAVEVEKKRSLGFAA